MKYEFRCLEHPEKKQEVWCTWREFDNIEVEKCPVCGERLEQELGTGDRSWFAQTFGKWTGVYDYDYGKKATWDLTPKGKLQELTRLGVCGDPFSKYAPANVRDGRKDIFDE